MVRALLIPHKTVLRVYENRDDVKPMLSASDNDVVVLGGDAWHDTLGISEAGARRFVMFGILHKR